MNQNIQLYGWKHFQLKTNISIDDNEIGRIRNVNKTNYDILTNQGILKGELTGQLLFTVSNEERPQTGDWVKIMPFDQQCIITEVLTRYNQLARKELGKKTDKQILATNINGAFIVQGLDRDFNPRRLERMLTTLNDANIEPFILLNKADIAEEAEENVQLIRENHPNIPVLKISALTKEGLEQIESLLQPQLTYIMIGSSGVGKSTILNNLMHNEVQKTNTISEAVGKGKHTTTSRELFLLDNGSVLIDTAGMREFGLALDDIESVTLSFDDINQLGKGCRYSDCTHIDEPGCTVLEAIDKGKLEESVYHSYIKLRSEAEHYAASTQDKKRKGKDLSKLVRNMKRYNIKKRY
ncbi:ribosome small subunit-dependent GTPase A [Carboxylicivirga marina]|uniref:ribosome small subunit-dependent GTPase A n=1 Tax=Carboxylicivirga marina TaxID=2800988 RepID=UPI002595AD35|nr:ribosome small subunit-dependent GTPase A [uncultured Carboxylicivirga sp.]